jgi:hypothetical protein
VSDTPTDRTDAAWDQSEVDCDYDSFGRAEYMRGFAEGLERELTERNAAIAEFAKGQAWAAPEWKAQPHIAKLFEIAKEAGGGAR